MSERRVPSTRRRRPPRRQSRIRLLFWLVVIVSLGGAGYFGWKILERNRTDGVAEPVAPVVEDPAEPSGDRAVVLVFPEWDAAGYVTEQRLIPSRDRTDEDLHGLMSLLCSGPRISGAVSALPEGTHCLGAFYDEQNGSAVLDFSQELVIGHPGGTAAEAATLTSILRTVGLNFPETRSCLILVDGAQVETLAGHLKMDRPFDVRRFL